MSGRAGYSPAIDIPPGDFLQAPVGLLDNTPVVWDDDTGQLGDGTAILETKAHASGTYLAPDVVLHRPTGVVAVDKIVLSDAATDCPDGGMIWMPNAGDTPWATDEAWVLPDKHLSIIGPGSRPVGWAVDEPGSAPFLSGAVILQTGAGLNGIHVTGGRKKVQLRGFGIVFDDAIRFSDTGHGIDTTPAATYGAGHDIGVINADWSDIAVFGHDGDHYAYNLVNMMLSTLSNLRFYGGGGIMFKQDSDAIVGGNCVFIHPYGVLMVGGTAHGYAISGFAAAGSSGAVNLLTYIRPQVNAEDWSGSAGFGNPAEPTAAQYLFLNGAGGHQAVRSGIIHPDFEADIVGVDNGIDFGDFGNITVTNAGGLLTSTGVSPVFASVRPAFTGTPASVAGPATGAGDGSVFLASATGGAPTDLGGVISITTGAVPGASLTDAATITFAQLPEAVAIVVTPQNDAAAQKQWLCIPTADGFKIRCEQVLGAGGWQYVLNYAVVPRYF